MPHFQTRHREEPFAREATPHLQNCRYEERFSATRDLLLSHKQQIPGATRTESLANGEDRTAKNGSLANSVVISAHVIDHRLRSCRRTKLPDGLRQGPAVVGEKSSWNAHCGRLQPGLTCESSARASYAQFGDVVEDIYEGCGPLGGIHAVLSATDTDLNLVLSVDMPLMSPEFLHWPVQQASDGEQMITVSEADGGQQTLCGLSQTAGRRG